MIWAVVILLFILLLGVINRINELEKRLNDTDEHLDYVIENHNERLKDIDDYLDNLDQWIRGLN